MKTIHNSSTKEILLADFFNCSTDFLLGLEDENYSSYFEKCPPRRSGIGYSVNLKAAEGNVGGEKNLLISLYQNAKYGKRNNMTYQGKSCHI
mgnify:CR=1 FL=1